MTKAEKQREIEFLNIVKQKCEDNNVKLELINRTKIFYWKDIYIGGYFLDQQNGTGILSCAVKNKFFLSTLVHEYSHMEQWIEETEVWNNVKYISDLDDWLAGENVRDIENKINKIKLLELDCEKRSIKNIKKYKLPIDLIEYTKKANSYLLFHNYLKITRNWGKPTNSPINTKNKNIWEKCPSKIMPESYYDVIPKKILNEFIISKI